MRNRFTQKAQNALNLALGSASDMGHTYIGSEHLLLGLCREESSVAAHYLQSRGVDTEKIKNAIIRISGAGVPSSVSATDMTPRTKSIIQASLTEAPAGRAELRGTAVRWWKESFVFAPPSALLRAHSSRRAVRAPLLSEEG